MLKFESKYVALFTIMMWKQCSSHTLAANYDKREYVDFQKAALGRMKRSHWISAVTFLPSLGFASFAVWIISSREIIIIHIHDGQTEWPRSQFHISIIVVTHLSRWKNVIKILRYARANNLFSSRQRESQCEWETKKKRTQTSNDPSTICHSETGWLYYVWFLMCAWLYSPLFCARCCLCYQFIVLYFLPIVPTGYQQQMVLMSTTVEQFPSLHPSIHVRANSNGVRHRGLLRSG